MGENQKRIETSVAKAVHSLGANGEYIQIAGNGPNALDFHIAFYIGKYSVECPGASFHILSADKGFDPLIKHLKEQKVFCSRSPSVSDIPLIKSTDFFQKCIVPSNNRPANIKKLENAISAYFLKRLSPEQISDVVEALKRAGRIMVNGSKVEYTKQP